MDPVEFPILALMVGAIVAQVSQFGQNKLVDALFNYLSRDEPSASSSTEAGFIQLVDQLCRSLGPSGRFKRSINSWMRGRLLGSGSFGTVYEGISEDGFSFAVKEVSLLDQDQGSNANQCIIQLEQEIALLSQFEHDNIVQYFGSDKKEGKLYIFLELASQGSLASLYKSRPLQDSEVSAYTRQILSGLKYLHDRNVVHRDIKCANILVSSNGSVKLADFGVAKEITKLNVLKSCKGSARWMAPEVVNPKCPYGPPADIWSFGCTVLEMLTRQVPYPNLEWQQALCKIFQGEKPPIPDSLSWDARDFIQKCVQLNPDDRPTASELMEHSFIKISLSASTSPPIPDSLSWDARDFIQKSVQFNLDDRPTASELMELSIIKISLSASTSLDVSLRKRKRQSG